MDVKNQKTYGVWTIENDCSYWMLYDSVKDAVESSEEDAVEVYELQPKLLGTYTVETVLTKVRKKAS